MPQSGSRKRPAPGTSPEQQPQQIDAQTILSQLGLDSYPQWNSTDQASTQTSYPNPSRTSTQPQITLTPQQPPPSNQVARRPPGHDSTRRTTNANEGTSNTELWPSSANNGVQRSGDTDWPNSGDELDQKALLAKMDAQMKRKQIPPFIQKLSSFLDESRNTELIRWSDSGDSFVVVDEEEFARTLIPELFKHKNYASFVRQLNMYGFHKQVGLADNSMRASERKNKSPSEYYNPYFKRGRPNLLWLIHKPTPSPRGGGKGPRGKQDDGNLDEDVEEIYDMDRPNNTDQTPMDASNMRQGRQPLMLGNGGNTPQNLSAVQEELQAVRKQQNMIAALLQKTRAEHEQLYGQAANFQKLHDRHENSINAILTFLATVYTRNLEGKNGQNFGGMFGSIGQDGQAQGNVVDVGDVGGQSMVAGQNQGAFRRQPLLLQAPPGDYQRGSISSPAGTINSPASQRPHTTDGQRSGHSTAARGYFDTPSARSSQSPQVQPDTGTNGQQPSEADILSMIQSTNANTPFFTNGSQMDFPEALSHLQTADGQTPLTPNQRNDALQLMASTAAAGTSPAAGNGNNDNTNALKMQGGAGPAMMPGMAHYQQSKERIDQLSNALKEQGSKVEQLSNVLAPLSPSGSIPGLADPALHQHQQPNYGDPGDMLDLDQIFNSGDYFNGDVAGDDEGFRFDDPGELVPGFGANDFDEGVRFDEGGGAAAAAAAAADDRVGSGHGNGMGNGYGNGQRQFSFGLDGADDDDGENDNDGEPREDASAVETLDSSEATSPANPLIAEEGANAVDEGGGGGTLRPGKRRRKG
ncbi:MAG: hypothetical protein Q9169_005944 [Polycauliona sp. 2 TL-2023]